jgi:hypothetical protein
MHYYTQRENPSYTAFSGGNMPSNATNMMNNQRNFTTAENVCQVLYNKLQEQDEAYKQYEYFILEFQNIFSYFKYKDDGKDVFVNYCGKQIYVKDLMNAYQIHATPVVRFMAEMCIDLWYSYYGTEKLERDADRRNMGYDIKSMLSHGPKSEQYFKTIIAAFEEGEDCLIHALINIIIDAYNDVIIVRSNVMVVDGENYIWKKLYEDEDVIEDEDDDDSDDDSDYDYENDVQYNQAGKPLKFNIYLNKYETDDEYSDEEEFYGNGVDLYGEDTDDSGDEYCNAKHVNKIMWKKARTVVEYYSDED